MSSLKELTRRQKSASQIYKETYRMCYWEYDLKTKHFYANLHNLLLDEKKEVEDVISSFQDLYHDSDAELLKSQLLKIINSTKEVVFVVQGKMPKEFFQKMWNCIKQGQSWRECIKNKAKDGTYYWVDTIIVPIMNSGGELVEILSFRYEVTKYQEVLEENSRLKQLLESKNQHL